MLIWLGALTRIQRPGICRQDGRTARVSCVVALRPGSWMEHQPRALQPHTTRCCLGFEVLGFWILNFVFQAAKPPPPLQLPSPLLVNLRGSTSNRVLGPRCTCVARSSSSSSSCSHKSTQPSVSVHYQIQGFSRHASPLNEPWNARVSVSGPALEACGQRALPKRPRVTTTRRTRLYEQRQRIRALGQSRVSTSRRNTRVFCWLPQ